MSIWHVSCLGYSGDEPFTVWSKMRDSDCKDYEKVKEFPSDAFDLNPATAYRMFL